MTQSKSPVTSSPETTNNVKKKRSYIAKVFGGRRKSKERKEEKKRLALSSTGSDGDGHASPRRGVHENKTKHRNRNEDSNRKNVADKSSSDENCKTPEKIKKKRALFKHWGKKRQPDINMVSVELSLPTDESPPDVITQAARHSSVTTKSADRGKKGDKVSNDNNNNSSANLNDSNISSPHKDIPNGAISPTRKTPKKIQEANISAGGRTWKPPSNAFQYESATVGRRPIRRKQSGGDADGSCSGFRRSRSFSGNAAANHHPRSNTKMKPERKETDEVPPSNYVKLCRQSNHALDSYNKGSSATKSDSGFLRWHSVGDIQRQVAREKTSDPTPHQPTNISTSQNTKKVKSQTKSSKGKKSLSLQDLTFQDVCETEQQSPSAYDRISRRYPRSPSSGDVPKHTKPHQPIPPHLKHIQKSRPFLDKALSKSEANIWTQRREPVGGNNTILAFKKVNLSRNLPQEKSSSPKRHSADVLEMSSLVYPTYKSPVGTGQSWDSKHIKKYNSEYVGSKSDSPFQYNMTENAMVDRTSPRYQNQPDLVYNHTTPVSENSSSNNNSPKKLPYVACGTNSLLRGSKSTGALLGQDVDDMGWSATPSVRKSVYEQREPLPDYSQDVEVLLSKLRSSLREKGPPRPPKSYQVQQQNEERSRHHSSIGNGGYPPLFDARFNTDSQFRNVSSSPHRALPTTSQLDNRGNGVSRSRSRARSIAKRFNFSGSTENLSSPPLSLCTSGNWSIELDQGDEEGVYCNMKPLVKPTLNQTVPPNAHVVKMRHCPNPESPRDYVYLSGQNSENRLAATNIPNGHSNVQVRMRHKDNNAIYSTSNGHPTVGGTFYYGRRPVSTSYAEQQYAFKQFQNINHSRQGGSNCSSTPRNEAGKRPKIFYALDV